MNVAPPLRVEPGPPRRRSHLRREALREARFFAAALAYALALTGCASDCGRTDDATPTVSAEPLPSSRPAPWETVRYPPEPLATLRDDTARWQGKDISTAARVMVHHVVASDGVRIALQLTRDADDEPDDEPTRHWLDDVLDSLEAIVHMPDGSERKLTALPAAAGAAASYRAAFRSPALAILRLDDAGVRSETGPQRAWREDASDVFTTRGSRRVVLRGSLDVAGRRVAFQTGELSYQVVGGSTRLPIAELERRAAHELFGPGRAAQVLAGPARSNVYVQAMRAVDDAAGNRWLWFVSYLGGGSGDRTDIHVNLTPSGELVALDRREEFTCLAEGTRLATVEGPKAIERVRPGDRVLAWDPAEAREVVTRVRSVVPRLAAPVLTVEGLRLTPNHPVFADGHFVPAGELAAGSSVLHRTQGWIGLDAVTAANERAVVYDVAVEAPHNFFADDLLVHNKVAPVPGPSDPWAFLFDRPTGPGWSERKWWRSRR